MLTQLRPDIQVGPSVSVNDQLPAGPTLQTSATSLNAELNAVKSQISRILSVQSQSWTSDISTDGGGNKRGLNALGSSLYNIESKPLLARATVQTTVAVPGGQNYVILSVSGNQAPSQVAAIQLTTLGAVVAQSSTSGAAFGANELTAVAGSSAAVPKNLCRVRSAGPTGTGQELENNDRDVFALLQVESTATDGSAFNDTVSGARVKLSFVSQDNTGNLIAVPASVTGGQTIQYSYVLRQIFSQLPEQSFIGSSEFNDSTSDLDVQLTRAVANQNGPVPVGKNLFWQVANGYNFKVQDQGGANDILAISAAAGANALSVNSNSATLNTTTPPVSKKGIIAAQTAQAINLGVTTGQIDSAGPLAVAATGSNALTLKGGTAVNLQDGYQAGSSWVSTGINLSSASADWSAYKAAVGGELSLLAGIAALASKTNRVVGRATVTANVPAGTLVTGYGTGANLNVGLPDYSGITGSIVQKMSVFYNGQQMWVGTSASDDCDVYIAGTPSKGELIFNFALRYTAGAADRILVILSGVPISY